MPYIDRDAIPYFFTEDGTRLIAFKDYVDKVPDSDVEPIKRAEWLPYTEYYADDYSECNIRKVWTCSRCGRLEKYKEPYCNCGAKMAEGE